MAKTSKYRKMNERVHGATDYEKMNGHLARMHERVEDLGVTGWGVWEVAPITDDRTRYSPSR